MQIENVIVHEPKLLFIYITTILSSNFEVFKNINKKSLALVSAIALLELFQ